MKKLGSYIWSLSQSVLIELEINWSKKSTKKCTFSLCFALMGEHKDCRKSFLETNWLYSVSTSKPEAIIQVERILLSHILVCPSEITGEIKQMFWRVKSQTGRISGFCGRPLWLNCEVDALIHGSLVSQEPLQCWTMYSLQAICM